MRTYRSSTIMRGIAALACALGTTAHATGATPLAPAAALSVAATGIT
ncbi:MAG: hypothetical protein IPM40_20435 [Gammaproteobacteria bacterium]|nr:hypothetical protein [Gammaproteobacteria bacterium]